MKVLGIIAKRGELRLEQSEGGPYGRLDAVALLKKMRDSEEYLESVSDVLQKASLGLILEQAGGYSALLLVRSSTKIKYQEGKVVLKGWQASVACLCRTGLY